MSGPGGWITRPDVQSPSPVQHCLGGQNSQPSGPPLPWAQAKASSLSPAPGKAGELRRGIKSLTPRDSGLEVSIKHPVAPPRPDLLAHLQELSDCPSMGHPNLLL